MNTATEIAVPRKETPQKKKRLPEIMLAGAIFCFCVILIHSSSELVTVGNRENFLYQIVATAWRMSGFATQGFVFLAGLRFFISVKDKENFNPLKYILSRFWRIIPLYLVWSVIYYGYSVYMQYEPFDIARFIRGLLSGDLTAHLYYVPVILQFALLAPISLLLRKKLPGSVILPASVLLTSIFGDHLPDLLNVLFPNMTPFPYSDRVFTAFLIFWSAGCCAGAAYDRFCKMLDSCRILISVCFVICTVLDLGAMYYSYVVGRFVWCIKQIQTLYILTAIIFVMMISRWITGKLRSIPTFLQYVDLAGYSIYLSHIFPLWLIQYAISMLGIGAAYGFLLRISGLLLWAVILSFMYVLLLYRIHGSTK